MDWALLIATAIASAAAVAGAVVAVVQARAARRSERDAAASRDESRAARDESARLAAESNSHLARLSAAQERANALKEAEMEPPPWSNPRWVSGEVWAVTNMSGRTIRLEGLDVQPDGSEGLFRLASGSEDGVYQFGDTFEYVAGRRWGNRPTRLTLLWRYEDEHPSPLREFIIPL